MRTTVRRAGIVVGGVAVVVILAGGWAWNAARTPEPPAPSGPRKVTRDSVKWIDSGRVVRATAYVPEGADRLPVLLFAAGFGVDVREYSTFLTDLASNGFLVVGVPSPAIADPDNTQLYNAQPRFARALVAALSGVERLPRVDTSRIAAIGHSVGGGAAAHACLMEPRFRAAIDFDGTIYGPVVHQGVPCPFLLIERAFIVTDTLNDPPTWYEERNQGRLHEDSVFLHSPAMHWATIDFLDHMSFTDGGLRFRTSHWLRESIGLRLPATEAQRISVGLAVEFLANPTRRLAPRKGVTIRAKTP